jgi:hypothetical protein
MPKLGLPVDLPRRNLRFLVGSGLAAVLAFAVVEASSLLFLRHQSQQLALASTQSLARSLELLFAGQINTIDVSL